MDRVRPRVYRERAPVGPGVLACILLIEAGDEQPISLDHHLRIARLHREDEVVITRITCDAGELQRTLHHPEWRVAVAVHDAVAKRAVIRPDAHRAAVFLAETN